MNLLLINPNSFQESGDRKIVYYPTNYAYLSSYLKLLGHEVEMIDALWYDYSPQDVVNLIDNSDKKWDCIGLGGQINYYSFIKKFSRLQKEKDGETFILLGGPMTFGLEDQLLNLIPDIDFLILGEGFDATDSILRSSQDKVDLGSLSLIKGVVFKSNGKMVNTGYPEEKDINALPFPDWTLADYNQYLKKSYLHDGNNSAHVIAGRGCPFKCVYCSAHFNKLRLRSVENVIKEVESLKDQYLVDDIVFLDETFTYNKRWLKAICKQLKSLDVTWLARTRVDLVDAEILKMMKDSGCRMVNYGIESGSEIILNQMKKKISIEQIERALDLTREIKIPFSTNFMIGMPGETLETLRETEEFLIRNDLRCGFAYTVPLPGTKLFHDVLESLSDLDTYLSSLKGYFFDHLLINMTELSDLELMDQKNHIEYRTSYYYFKKRYPLLTPLFHKLFYLWQQAADRFRLLSIPLGWIKRMFL